MHNVKQNVKQLLMPWKRKLSEDGEEEVQSNDDFGTHPVLQVCIYISNSTCTQHAIWCCLCCHAIGAECLVQPLSPEHVREYQLSDQHNGCMLLIGVNQYCFLSSVVC